MASNLVAQAIRDSKNETRIARIDAIDCQRAGLTIESVCRELAEECEGSADAAEHEFWGRDVDVDGTTWRIHVERAQGVQS